MKIYVTIFIWVCQQPDGISINLYRTVKTILDIAFNQLTICCLLGLWYIPEIRFNEFHVVSFKWFTSHKTIWATLLVHAETSWNL